MLKALGNPVRFQIVEFLARKKTCTAFDCRCMNFVGNPNLTKVLKPVDQDMSPEQPLRMAP